MLSKGPNIDDILMEGIYGKKEINPDERRKYLGTLRERIVAVLTVSQVYEPKVYQELVEFMKKHSKAKLLLNGSIPYNFLQKYTQIANKQNMPFTIVENKESDTDIGIVLAYDYAVDIEEIYINTDKKSDESKSKKQKQTNTTGSKKGIFKKLFSRT